MLRTVRLRRSHELSVAAVAMLAWACAADEEQLDPPDLSPLVHAYQYPDAELNRAEVQQLLASSQPMLNAASAASGFDFIVDSIDSTKRGLEERGVDGTLELEGDATVRSICPGFAEGDVPDEARDGFIELAIPIEDAALGPVAFGRAEHCRSLQQSSRTQLDGPIAIHFGAPLELGSPITPAPLIRIDGVLAIDGLPPVSGFDVRLPVPGVTEVRVVLPTGETAVLGVSATSITVRERRGTWSCAVQGGTSCVRGF